MIPSGTNNSPAAVSIQLCKPYHYETRSGEFLFFFFWPLRFLSFDLQIVIIPLVTPLAYSNSFYPHWSDSRYVFPLAPYLVYITSLLPVSRCYLKLCPINKAPTWRTLILGRGGGGAIHRHLTTSHKASRSGDIYSSNPIMCIDGCVLVIKRYILLHVRA
jgi:hypothetical protein